MRPGRPHDERVAEVTQRRLEALGAELGLAPRAQDLAQPAATAELAPGPEQGAVAVGRHARRPIAGKRRILAWAGDRVPATLQGRVHLGAAQLGVVALVVAIGLLVTAWWLTSSAARRGEAVPPRVVPGTGSAAASRPPVDDSPSAAPASGQAVVVVDVGGKVRRPGIAVLPVGSRVVDALKAAGGTRASVDLSTTNLARVLVDGEQILIGTDVAQSLSPGGQAGAPGVPAGAALVNLNTADQTLLETLPGVGPVTAASILQWRTEHGGFTAIEELLEVSGIGDATLAQIAPHVTV